MICSHHKLHHPTMTNKVHVLMVLVFVATLVLVGLLLVENPVLDLLTAATPATKVKEIIPGSGSGPAAAAAAAVAASSSDALPFNASTKLSSSLRTNNTAPAPKGPLSQPAFSKKKDPQRHHDKDPTTNATIVCQLSGELGNNLAKYAHCYAIQQWLQTRYNLPSKIVLRHQLVSKWVYGDHDAHLCFPHLRPLNFSEGNTPEFDVRAKEQEQWHGDGTTVMTNPYYRINSFDPLVVERALNIFVNHTKRRRRQQQQQIERVEPPLTYPVPSSHNSTTHNAAGNSSAAIPTRWNISVPFLYGNYFALQDKFVDDTIDDLREIFAFDRISKECCQVVPDPDESVFHLRNFLVEMPRAGKGLGFEELGPTQTARDLFGHLNPGDKVAILSRFSQESSQPYIDALVQRGLQVRFITGQSGVQDFCFLMSAQKEMIGIAISTYFVWASYLSNCTRVVAYSLDTPERQQQDRPFLSYDFTNPGLQSRIHFVLIRPDAPTPAPVALVSAEAAAAAAAAATPPPPPKPEPLHVGSISTALGPVDCSTLPRDPDPHIWLHNFTNFTAAVDRGWWSGRGTDLWSDEHTRMPFFPLLLNGSSSRHDELFVDVGANVGQMAMVGLVANFTTFAFEPIEYDILKLCEGVRQNVERGYLLPRQAQANLHLYRLIVGNASLRAVNISRPETRFGKFEQSSLAGETIGVATKPRLEVETVPMVRLDDVLPPDAPIGVVKINVQGTELMVVEGMRGILGRSTGYPHTIHYSESRRVTMGAGYRIGTVQGILESYGYTCTVLWNDVTCRKPWTAP